MSKPFDMELFLAGVLTGSHATRKRHVQQAKVIQTEIADRWLQKNALGLAEKASRVVPYTSPNKTQRGDAILVLADCRFACSSIRKIMGA